jgi:hypothetical protein
MEAALGSYIKYIIFLRAYNTAARYKQLPHYGFQADFETFSVKRYM